ncbi:MAG TPA: hypothetical protein VKA18_08305 [Alphaproteobacteria bacterium]|nr:hypothetical protein [Alphaproteobacteria bacterium]
MTIAVSDDRRVLFPLRLMGALRDLLVGTLFCLTPVTAVVVLGWLVRRMKANVAQRRGQPVARPGWLLGARGQGGFVQILFGGLAANIRSGLLATVGLAILTLPFTLAWLGAWWAGWENSFNKGYEQAEVGPAVWAAATLLALPVLAHLPLALAHGAVENRFRALFEVQRINRIARAAGPRLVWLAMLSVFAAVPFFGLRAVPVFVEEIVPGFSAMSAEEQGNVAGLFDLLGAAAAFLAALFLKHRAAVIYSKAVEVERARLGWVWVGLAAVIWAALPVMIVVGQFMNYSAVLWLNHPVILLPWAG